MVKRFSNFVGAVLVAACAVGCSPDDGITSGTGGAGAVAACPPGQSQCGTACVDLATNPQNCGICSTQCDTGSACVGGSCACQAGFMDCGTGCTELATDAANCGICGTSCPTDTPYCSQGACSASCGAGLTPCGLSCVDLNSSDQNCSACGAACGAGKVCQSGACGCAVGIDCSGTCVDSQSDPMNCGTCGRQCTGGAICTAGDCVGGTDTPATGGQPGSGGQASTGGQPGAGGSGGTPGAGGSQATGGAVDGSGGMVDGSGGMVDGSGGADTASGGSAGTTGSDPTGGAAGDSTSEEPPDGLTGVVLDIDADTEGLQLGCVPICQETAHEDDEDTTDDWAYEGFACILSGTATANNNAACTTGEPVPEIDRNGLPGIVVQADDDEELECVPLCAEGTEASDPDPENPSSNDWGWEYQASCIVRGSPTAACNLVCTTGDPVPDPTLAPRSGVFRDDACVALCECDPNPCSAEDEEAGDCSPDWGWEYQAACVVPGSDAADVPETCTTGEAQDLTPPALDPSRKTHDGFYVESGRLYDAYGGEFVIRGVNNAHIWFDVGNQYLAYQALDAIESYGTNTIRVVWETTTEQDGAQVAPSTVLLAKILYRIVELNMVPMIELHDATGASDTGTLQAMANYYSGSDVKDVLLAFREYLLINIANEWNGNLSSYSSVISSLRSSGIEHTLVIDASGSGQDISSITSNAPALLSADSNLLFSVHMYGQYNSASAVTTALQSAQGASIPLIVGEFGPEHSGQTVAWTTILSECQSRGIGYIPWSWMGNDSTNAALNMVTDWGGQLTTWGRNVMESDANSIGNTASKASIFQ